jgi:hypothetical protein
VFGPVLPAHHRQAEFRAADGTAGAPAGGEPQFLAGQAQGLLVVTEGVGGLGCQGTPRQDRRVDAAVVQHPASAGAEVCARPVRIVFGTGQHASGEEQVGGGGALLGEGRDRSGGDLAGPVGAAVQEVRDQVERGPVGDEQRVEAGQRQLRLGGGQVAGGRVGAAVPDVQVGSDGQDVGDGYGRALPVCLVEQSGEVGLGLVTVVGE